jgi:hypothetical protein
MEQLARGCWLGDRAEVEARGSCGAARGARPGGRRRHSRQSRRARAAGRRRQARRRLSSGGGLPAPAGRGWRRRRLGRGPVGRSLWVCKTARCGGCWHAGRPGLWRGRHPSGCRRGTTADRGSPYPEPPAERRGREESGPGPGGWRAAPWGERSPGRGAGQAGNQIERGGALERQKEGRRQGFLQRGRALAGQRAWQGWTKGAGASAGLQRAYARQMAKGARCLGKRPHNGRQHDTASGGGAWRGGGRARPARHAAPRSSSRRAAPRSAASGPLPPPPPRPRPCRSRADANAAAPNARASDAT